MILSLALCPDDAKQDPVVYVPEFGVVYLAKGPRTASIQEGRDWTSSTIGAGGDVTYLSPFWEGTARK